MLTTEDLKLLTEALNITLPDDVAKLPEDDQKHLAKLLNDFQRIQVDLLKLNQNNAKPLDCVRLELLRLATQVKLNNNLKALTAKLPASRQFINAQPNYLGLDKIDSKLERYLDFDNGFYIELGANDGLSQSNTAYFERYKGWKGVLIEPILHNYLACRQNRSAENYFSNCACVPFDYVGDTVKLYYSNLMTAQDSTHSTLDDINEHVQRGKRFLKPYEEVLPYFAVAKTITSVLDEAAAPKIIDFLSLDVEGVELEVLKGLDFGKYRINFMLIETNKVDIISDFLRQHGYSIVDRLSYHDYLFKLENKS